MPQGETYSKRRETLLRLPIGELSAWHLVASCPACRADRYLPIADLVTRFGEAATLAALVPRLRCRVVGCRQPPSAVLLRNRYPAQMGGGEFVAVTLRGE
jgi:hypothetical protein